MNNVRKLFLITIFLIPLFGGCFENLDTTSPPGEGQSGGNIGGDTIYVKLNPAWGGFNKPQAIIIGKEPFIYVADTENNRIVMLNLNGEVLGTREVKRPIALAQDHLLNLIVCAEFDTVGQTFGAVYKFDLVSASHQISSAPVRRLLPRSIDLNRPDRRYTGVAAFYDNTFYVARTGPSNNNFIDPDNSILIFHPKKMYGGGAGDTLIGRLANIEPVSTGLVSANQISSLTSFNRKNIDLVVTLISNTSLKAQWWNYTITPIDEKYLSRFSPGDGVEFMSPDKFELPEGSTIDNLGNIYIADAGKDSIYKFNSFGDELQSFGGDSLFSKPHDVAFFDQTLYVLDTGNNRIVRFVLSTDLR